MTPAATQRLAMAAAILSFEARTDKRGRLTVYSLPPDDGGGVPCPGYPHGYEVAGLNNKYNPTEAPKLKAMIEAGNFEDALAYAIEAIADDTDAVATWATEPAIQFMLRDTAFNRGARGCARILQRALRVKIDGKVGPKTRAALAVAESETKTLVSLLRIAREDYERQEIGMRSRFEKGLISRWKQAAAKALEFL